MALNKQQTQLIIVGAGVLVLIFILTNTFKGKKKTAAKPKAPSAAVESSVSAVSPAAPGPTPAVSQPKIGGFAAPDKKIIQAQLSRIGSQESIKDPFYPVEEKISSKKGSLVLKGISWKENGHSFAIINEEVVKVGDVILDSKVISIDKKQVTLEKDGQEYILILEE